MEPITSRMRDGRGALPTPLSEMPEMMEAEHVKTPDRFSCLQKLEPSVPLPHIPFLLSRSPGKEYSLMTNSSSQVSSPEEWSMSFERILFLVRRGLKKRGKYFLIKTFLILKLRKICPCDLFSSRSLKFSFLKMKTSSLKFIANQFA